MKIKWQKQNLINQTVLQTHKVCWCPSSSRYPFMYMFNIACSSWKSFEIHNGFLLSPSYREGLRPRNIKKLGEVHICCAAELSLTAKSLSTEVLNVSPPDSAVMERKLGDQGHGLEPGSKRHSYIFHRSLCDSRNVS